MKMDKFIVILFGDWKENFESEVVGESINDVMMKSDKDYYKKEMEEVSINNGCVWDGNNVEDEFGRRIVNIDKMEYGVVYNSDLSEFKRDDEKIEMYVYEFEDKMEDVLFLSDDYELMVKVKVSEIGDEWEIKV